MLYIKIMCTAVHKQKRIAEVPDFVSSVYFLPFFFLHRFLLQVVLTTNMPHFSFLRSESQLWIVQTLLAYRYVSGGIFLIVI